MKRIEKIVGDKMISGDRVILRKLKISDITQRYIDWLNDPQVNQFLSVRDNQQNIDKVKNYIHSFKNNKNKLLFGIFEINTKLHIGNITFSSIDWKNEVGVVGIAIGDKNFWGKGFATEALRLAIKYAFAYLKLHRLEAGVNINNIASCKLFERVGFIRDGILKDREKVGDNYVAGIIYGLLNNQIGKK